MGEVVKVYTDRLEINGYGDFVRCADCGALMLVGIGEMLCANCKSDTLIWADENLECSVAELK